jgi:hypothetical protein
MDKRNNIGKICAVSALGGLLAALCGCTYTMPTQTIASNTLLVPNSYKVVGPASGESCESHFLNILVSNSARLQGAIDDALQKSGGDAMIEMTTDFQESNYYIFDERCTLVNGLAVKIITPAEREGK